MRERLASANLVSGETRNAVAVVIIGGAATRSLVLIWSLIWSFRAFRAMPETGAATHVRDTIGRISKEKWH